jgi:hypothetical protein
MAGMFSLPPPASFLDLRKNNLADLLAWTWDGTSGGGGGNGWEGFRWDLPSPRLSVETCVWWDFELTGQFWSFVWVSLSHLVDKGSFGSCDKATGSSTTPTIC